MSHRPRKRFGQNFLHDQGVIARILDCVDPQTAQHLVEIGPGQGAITAGLLEAANVFDAVELDRDLAARLRERFGALPHFRLHQADALQFDFCRLATEPHVLRLVGNLPYNVSTPLLFHLLGQAKCIDDMHFMLQKEVVDRMAAQPGGKRYGRLSVMLQLHCEIVPLFDIDPKAFKPVPKVVSAFVRLCPHRRPPWPIADPRLLERLVALAFNQRRKTLRNALKEVIRPENFASLDLDPSLRPEQLSPQTFVALANAACNLPPSS